MLCEERLQFPGRPGLGAARHQALDPHLLSLESMLIEPRGLGQQRGLIGEVGERRSSPEGQGIIECADGDVRIRGKGLLRVSHERVEP